MVSLYSDVLLKDGIVCVSRARKLTKRLGEVNFPPNVARCRNRLSGIYRHRWRSQHPGGALEPLEQADPSHDVAVARGGLCPACLACHSAASTSALGLGPDQTRPGQTRPRPDRAARLALAPRAFYISLLLQNSRGQANIQ